MPAPILVLSHLRWDFVFQRPQQLLSRFARTGRRILFVEEPVHLPDTPAPAWRLASPLPNLTVAQPTLPQPCHGFTDASLPALAPLLDQLLDEQRLDDPGFDHPVVWFYTPMALPLLGGIDPAAIVYDCMDELSSFQNAPPQLVQREADLLRRADLVLTGGPSLFRAKRDRNPNVHCFPSSVDAAHFGRAADPAAQDHPDQAAVARPRLGFFGVIDERLDIPLLDHLARSRPDWQLVMVGPVVKIDPASLPQHPNLHYLGQRAYADLPAFLAGWDLCLLPFARNQATRYISPTKTLEYMAAQRLIVSTPITDVAEPYGRIVFLGDDAEAFTHACEEALALSAVAKQDRLDVMKGVLEKTSWDATAASVLDLVDQACDTRRGRALSATAAVSAESDAADAESETAPAASAPVVVVGAGPTGLSAAYHLGAHAVLLEKNARVGGWCRSVVDRGFTFDFAGHIMFSNDPYVHEMYQTLLGENVHWQDREAWVYSKNVYTRYPFQGALYGLPPDVIKECILGAVEARFGSLKPASPAAANAAAQAPAPASPSAPTLNPNPAGNGNGHGSGGNGQTQVHGNGGNGHGQAHTPRAASASAAPLPHHGGHNGDASNAPASPGGTLSRCAVGDVKDCCADGVLESTARLGRPNAAHGNGGASGAGAAPGSSAALGANAPQPAPAAGPPQNFEEFIYRVWGAGIAKHFAIPYNKKLWAVPLSEMETSWLGGRVPMPDLAEMLDGALKPAPRPMGPNARFGYPLRGGFQSLMDGFLPLLQGQLILNAPVAAVSPQRRVVTLTDGREIPYDMLVSTMPLPLLIRAIEGPIPDDVRDAAAALRHVSVRCVNLGVGRPGLTEKHWIYYPEETVFHRIFVQGNASPFCNPPGGFGLTCEITYSPHKPLPCEGDDLVQRCIRDCQEVGILRADDPILAANQIDMPFAYVVYDHGRASRVALIRQWLLEQDIVLAGRYSEWEYYNSDHAFIAGKKAAERVRELQRHRAARA